MRYNAIFMDTGAWFALADESDQYHKQAVGIYPGLIKDNHRLTTTNLVIAETYILIRSAIGPSTGHDIFAEHRGKPESR